MMSTIVLLVALAATAPVKDADLAAIITGDWCAGSTDAFHEEFSLVIEDGTRKFESWLHQKPALTGTWELPGGVLIIRGSNGHRMEYRIISASGTRLVLREKGNERNETYVRNGRCVAFDGPPSE